MAVLTRPAALGTRSSRLRVAERRSDRHRELADAVDLGRELVARDRRPHARRSAGENDVARRERHLLRELGDDLRHAPDQLLEIAVLAHGAVDRKPDASLARMPDLGRRLEGAARRRSIERLADLPRALDVPRGDLEIAAGQIDAHRVAVDEVERALGRDLAPA